MASEKNLNAVFTDIANAIRGKKGTTDQIKPINMADEIVNLPSGGGGSLKALLDATKKCSNLFSGYNGASVEGLISYSDTSNVTTFHYMFYGCNNLITVPQIDTSQGTNFHGMFYNCIELKSVPQMNTSKATTLRGLYSGCRKLEDVKPIDTSLVTDIYEMYWACWKLTSIPEMDTSKVTNMGWAFGNCSILVSIPEMDTSKVTNMERTFVNDKMLESIPKLNVSEVTNFKYAFDGCTSLRSILMYGMKANFDISASTRFEKSDLVTILNNLATVTSTQTLTMGSTNLAKLTDEEKAIATNKGWTLA